MPKVTVKLRKRLKVAVKIRKSSACPIITKIDGGTPEGNFGTINGYLNGGTP